MLPTDKCPAGSRPLYRIMTKKSRLAFGKYADLTVGDVLKVNEEYIVYIYAMYPNISLHKDILEELHLRAIPKPGVDEEVLHEYRKAKRAQYTTEQWLHGKFAKARKKRDMAVARMLDAKRATTFSKRELQAINHGHGQRHDY